MPKPLAKSTLPKRACFACGKTVAYAVNTDSPWPHKAPCKLECIGGVGFRRSNQHNGECPICAPKAGANG